MNSKTSNPIIKSMRVIGDLDHEFYDDERQREVWNEASAVGFQFALWASLVSAAILPWVAGKTGAWIALGLLIGGGMASIAVTTYAKALRVDASTALSPWRPRALVSYLLGSVAVVGICKYLLFADYPSKTNSSIITSCVAGVLSAAAAGSVVANRKRRKEAELQADEEL